MSVQTIELDCAPGGMRPGDLIGGVIEGTGLQSRESVSRFFGNWTYDYSDVDPKEWERIREIIVPRIIALHKSGLIRYGSW
jgi:hypothetical protein